MSATVLAEPGHENQIIILGSQIFQGENQQCDEEEQPWGPQYASENSCHTVQAVHDQNDEQDMVLRQILTDRVRIVGPLENLGKILSAKKQSV